MSEDSEVADHLVPLARETSFELVADLLELLEKQDVPYVMQAGTAVRMLDDPPAEVTTPEPWEARVWVPASHERIARELFEELTNERRAQRDRQVTERYLDATGSR